MKIFCLLICSFFLCNTMVAQNSEWIFYGLLLQEDVGCNNPAFTKYEFRWIEKDRSVVNNKPVYETAMDDFYTDFKNRNSNNANAYVSRFTVQVSGDPLFIAIVEKHRKCSNGKIVNNLAFYRGDSEQALQKSIESDMRLYKEIVDYKIIKTWNCEEEYAQLKPPGKLSTVTEVNYKGLKIKNTIFKLSSGKNGIIIQGTNSLKDSSTLVKIRLPNSTTPIKIKLLPGEKFTQNVPFSAYDLEIGYAPYKSKMDIDLIKAVKNFVKDHISAEDGKIKRTNADGGVRG